jgi:hypothetical protein
MTTHVFAGSGDSGEIAVGSGGPMTIVAYGAFGGGTVTVEYTPNEGADWIADDEIAWTAAAIDQVVLPQGIGLRFVLTGATAPNLTVEARP